MFCGPAGGIRSTVFALTVFVFGVFPGTSRPEKHSAGHVGGAVQQTAE